MNAAVKSRASSRQARGVNHSDLMKTVRDYLRVVGAYEVKVLGGVGMRAGIADILCCLRGRFVAVEVKTGNAVLSEKQRAEGRAVEAAGGLFIEVRTIEDLEDALFLAGLIAAPSLMRFKQA